MKYIRATLIIAVTFVAGSGFSQSAAIKIRFIGNCGLHMTDGNLDVYVDFPYKSGAYGYMRYDVSELDSIAEDAVFIFTHKHKDHFSGKIMRRVLREKHGEKFTPWKTADLEKHARALPNFDIEVLKTKHSFSLRHRSYLITWHGKKIYLSGDTEHAEAIGEAGGIDWAFVPYWLLLDAQERGIEVDATKIGIYHIAPAQVPSAKEKWGNREKIHPFTTQGEIIEIEI